MEITAGINYENQVLITSEIVMIKSFSKKAEGFTVSACGGSVSQIANSVICRANEAGSPIHSRVAV